MGPGAASGAAALPESVNVYRADPDGNTWSVPQLPEHSGDEA